MRLILLGLSVWLALNALVAVWLTLRGRSKSRYRTVLQGQRRGA